MSIFSIFTLFGGLAFFLYGMNAMSAGLEKMAGGKLEQILLKVTSNKFVALAVGLGVTMVIQSSSALTVMLVGLVNSGIMQFTQTIGVLMGSNIGTTITAWILSLSGIESESVFINLFKPTNLSAVLSAVGIVFISFSKKEKLKNMGEIFVGFGILMFGMDLMSGAMEPLAESETFKGFMTAFKNPFIAVAVGTLITCVIQSSSASVGILQALSLTGGITYGMALPIIMGQNIGACSSAVISGLSATKEAKKVAVVHVAFNIIGTLIWLIPFVIISGLFDLPLLEKSISPVAIAIFHSVFNISTTVILLPFSKQLEKFANKVIHSEPVVKKYPKLDDRLLTVPSVAVGTAFDYTVEMSKLSINSLRNAISLFDGYEQSKEDDIKSTEEIIDKYEDKLGTFMVKLAHEQLNVADSRQISKMLHTINDFERLGDHACNLVKVSREMHDKKVYFSDEAQKELDVLTAALKEILNLTEQAFETSDSAVAARVEPLEQVIDKLISDIKNRHIDRLQKGECTIELGFMLNDLVTNYERVSDHCSNIAVAIIETEHGSFKTHEYLKKFKNEEDGSFEHTFDEYKKLFTLQK